MTQPRRFDTARFDNNRPHQASADRYDGVEYRPVGQHGLSLSPLGLGFWYNFGDNRPFDGQREIILGAFDRGVTHFDLANNYGPPMGAAEDTLGRLLRRELRPYRSEIVVSTKAGWDRWYGPYGSGAGKKHLLHSLDDSLDRLNVDYVDIYYSHKPDENTPLHETIAALGETVRQGKALFVGISSYSLERTIEARRIAAELSVPLIVNQAAYSLFNRWIEPELVAGIESNGLGAVTFSPLSQGLLSGRYAADSVPERSVPRPSFDDARVTDDVRARLRGLEAIARERGQTLSQLALAWSLRLPVVASTLIGVSTVEQLTENLGALENLTFSADELREIDRFAVAPGERL